jgi:hypothetical protein
MPIKIWVHELTQGAVVDGTAAEATSPEEAIFLAMDYRKEFPEDRYEIRVLVDNDVSDEDRTSLYAMASAQGVHLEET